MKTFTVSVVILALLLMQEIHQTQAFGELRLSIKKLHQIYHLKSAVAFHSCMPG